MQKQKRWGKVTNGDYPLVRGIRNEALRMKHFVCSHLFAYTAPARETMPPTQNTDTRIQY